MMPAALELVVDKPSISEASSWSTPNAAALVAAAHQEERNR